MIHNDVNMNSVHGERLYAIYTQLGLKEGDIVFIHSRLFSFGKLADIADETVEIFLNPLLNVIGYAKGTVAVLGYSPSYSSFGKPYIHEETPSESGILNEYIRKRTDSLRSFHPITSVIAIGREKETICKNTPRSAFGWGSPFHTMHRLGAKCLFLGVTLGQSCTFLHYVEHQYGVSHCYHKAFFHPAYKNGKLQPGPFMSFLRNRQSEEYNWHRFEQRTRERGLLRETSYLGAPIQLMNFTDCFEEGIRALDEDPCYFLKAPFYITE